MAEPGHHFILFDCISDIFYLPAGGKHWPYVTAKNLGSDPRFWGQILKVHCLLIDFKQFLH